MCKVIFRSISADGCHRFVVLYIAQTRIDLKPLLFNNMFFVLNNKHILPITSQSIFEVEYNMEELNPRNFKQS